MSASREKQKRQQAGRPQTTHGQARAKRNKVLAIVLTVVIVLAIIALMVWTSGILAKTATAATIGDESYSSGVVQYYYQSAYNRFVNNYGSYLTYFGLDTSLPLDSQMYDEEAGQTWADYFKETALSDMHQTVILSNEAKQQSFELPEEYQAELEETKEYILTYCVNNNITTATYFAYYGSAVTEQLYYEQLENTLLASAYSEHLMEEMDFTAAEIDAYYEENADDFDIVDYRYFYFSGTPATETDENGETIEPTEEETAAAMTAAKEQADEMAARLDEGEDFTELTQEYAAEGQEETYADASASTSSGVSKSSAGTASYAEWLFEADRAQGDITVSESTSGYYVMQFEARSRHEYHTMDARYIVFAPETLEDDETVTDEQKEAAKAKADAFLAEWEAGEATDESFSQLVKDNSEEDTTAKETGGLQEQMYQRTTNNLTEWVFDSERQAGDAEVIEVSDSYYVVYIVGQNEVYWKLQVENAMMTNEYNEWYEQQQADYPLVEDDYGMSFVK